jgi:type I restriction enzyme R subunit
MTIDVVSQDTVLASSWDAQAEEQARSIVAGFRQYLEQHRDEITALEIFYNRPRHARLRYEDVKRLSEAIAAPPLSLSADKLWQAYETLERNRVRGNSSTRRALTDIVSLIRYTIERDTDAQAVLEPYSERVARRFTAWLADQEQRRGQPFTDEQRRWLELIRDHIAASVTIEPDDFDYSPFHDRGGLGRAYQLFGDELATLLQDLNERLAA